MRRFGYGRHCHRNTGKQYGARLKLEFGDPEGGFASISELDPDAFCESSEEIVLDLRFYPDSGETPKEYIVPIKSARIIVDD